MGVYAQDGTSFQMVIKLLLTVIETDGSVWWLKKKVKIMQYTETIPDVKSITISKVAIDQFGEIGHNGINT